MTSYTIEYIPSTGRGSWTILGRARTPGMVRWKANRACEEAARFVGPAGEWGYQVRAVRDDGVVLSLADIAVLGAQS